MDLGPPPTAVHEVQPSFIRIRDRAMLDGNSSLIERSVLTKEILKRLRSTGQDALL